MSFICVCGGEKSLQQEELVIITSTDQQDREHARPEKFHSFRIKRL